MPLLSVHRKSFTSFCCAGRWTMKLPKQVVLVGGVDGVAKQLCDLREQVETLSDRMDQQFAYANATDAWLKDDEAEEEEVPDPDVIDV